MYCKLDGTEFKQRNNKVLIVAKCIVNGKQKEYCCTCFQGINSSKVYCKSLLIPCDIPGFTCINSSKVYCKLFKYRLV